MSYASALSARPQARPDDLSSDPSLRSRIGNWMSEPSNRARLSQALGAVATSFGAGAMGDFASSNADRLYGEIEKERAEAEALKKREQIMSSLGTAGVNVPGLEGLDDTSLQGVLRQSVMNRAFPKPVRPIRTSRAGGGGNQMKNALLAARNAAVDPGGPGGATITAEEAASIDSLRGALSNRAPAAPRTGSIQRAYEDAIAAGMSEEDARSASRIAAGLDPRQQMRGTTPRQAPATTSPLAPADPLGIR